MILIPKQKDYADTNVQLLGLLDQMTRTEQAERMNALQRAQVARNMGLADIAAQEMNRSTSKGVRGMTAADFNVADKGLAGQMRGVLEPPPEVAMSDKMQIAMQAANKAMAKQGGYGRGKGLVDAGQTTFDAERSLTPETNEYTPANASAAQKRILQVQDAQSKYESMKMQNMQAAPISSQATDQYDFFKQQYDAALATGKPGLIKDAYNDMVHKFKMLDNKFGWNMSSGLASLRPTFGGGGRGAGGGKYYINDLTGERRESSPGTDAKGNLPKGWRRVTEATDQAGIKMYEDILKNPDSTPEQIRDAEVRLSRLKGERERKQIVTATPLRGSTGFATGLDYQETGDYYEQVAAGPNNKNQVAAEPKGKPKLARDERGVMWDISDPKNPKRVR